MMAGSLLDKSLGFFESTQIVGFSFAIPFLECAKSPSRDDDPDGFPIFGIHQALLLEVWKKLTLYLHV